MEIIASAATIANVNAERIKMPQLRSKNSKVKMGFMPAYTPKLRAEPTEDSNIPLWQPDGTIKYASEDDFKWLVDHKKIDATKPAKVDVKAKDQQ